MHRSDPAAVALLPWWRHRAGALLAGAVLSLLLAGCGPSGGAGGPGGAASGAGGGGAGASAPGGGMPPPPPVGVINVQPAPVALNTELSGRLEAWRSAQVRARVAGIVQRRQFVEGAQVKAGQPLFEVDAAPYQAALASAEAALARAEATLAQAAAQIERNRPLAEAKAISAQEWLVTQTTQHVGKADVASAKAAVQTARINLGYTRIGAPIAGRVGRALVSEGALVGPTDATPLVLVQQTHPLYINFTQSAGDMMRLKRALSAGKLQRPGGAAAAELRVVLEDGSDYPLPGKLLFADSTVDAATGQINLRAELPNPDGLLLPGLFVKVRLHQASVERGVRVPQQAVTRGPAGDSVLVVGPDNKPQPRPVKVTGALAGDWVVTDGLAAGDRVIVDGFQKMRPGAPVTPVPWTPPGAPGAGGQTGGGPGGPAGAASGAAGGGAAAGSAPAAPSSAAASR